MTGRLGSLGTSVFDTDVYLVGASGGVYALLAAHLANVLLNYNNMEFGIVRLIGIFVVGKRRLFHSNFFRANFSNFQIFEFFKICSQCRRRIRHLRPVRSRATGSARLLRGPLDRCPGRPDHWPSRPQEFRAETSRAAHLVGGAGRLRGLHPLRHLVQRLQSGSVLSGMIHQTVCADCHLFFSDVVDAPAARWR